jgi:sulfopyruvate decarboxylase alpha subunit
VPEIETAGFDHVLTVPCSILSEWYAPSGRVKTLYLSREEEGVGLATGLVAAGRRPLLLIQNSGLGNCLNALGSLGVAYRVPLVVAVSLRGDAVDANPVQRPMGEATGQLVDALKCEHTTVTVAEGAGGLLRTLRERAERERRPQFLFLPRRSALC